MLAAAPRGKAAPCSPDIGDMPTSGKLTTRMDLPLALRTGLETGNLVLFVGAGVGHNLTDSANNNAPDAGQLAAEMAAHFKIDAGAKPELSKVSKIVEIRKGRAELDAYVIKRLSDLHPDAAFRWLFTRRWRAIFTTNYDAAIERAYELNGTVHQKPVPIVATADFRDYDLRFEVPVFHLHGWVRGAGKAQLVLTDDDYVRFRERRNMLFELLKTQFATASILYLGYSNADVNWKALLTDVEGEFYPASMPMSFRVAPSTDVLDREILEAKNILTIDGTVSQFVESAAKVVTVPATVPADAIARERAEIPPDLYSLFDQNPAATSRLLANWTYVNQANFAATPNLKGFLHGDIANWALLAQRIPFERDVESRIFDDVLDYATAQRPAVISILTLGSAGYGVSTVLGQLCVRFVTEHVGPVLFLNRGSALNEGDVDFAAQFVGDRPIFVIDNAADYSARLPQLIQSLRQAGRAACFVLGDRINEWRQRRPAIRAREHRIEPLSDAEIDRFLVFLDANSALGDLQHLDESMRVAAVKQKHEKQLLVALREITESRSFDAIIEDEFRSLSREPVRRLYAAVCCFYHLRTPVRDQLLARLLNVRLEDLYKEMGDELEGVIEHECINVATGEYAARARHPVIAQVVWDRCLTAGERDDLALRAIDGLNLSYHLDLLVFDHFVRSDRHVDELSTLDAKTRFFEIACRKAPANAYVRQHYARMLYRENRFEAALAQVEMALTMESARVFFHTKGKILERMAIAADSIEVARRRLAQSEDVHNAARRMNPRDSYAYQGLAELYLGWAKRAPDSDEAASYVTKAEAVLAEGLGQVSDREGLYIVSAEIQRWLGDHPAAIDALRRAVAASPSGELPRYLLGRAFERARDYNGALDVLRPVIESDPAAFRAFIVYARAMIAVGKSFREAAAVLRIAEGVGRRDPRYLAMLGGMLSLASEFTAAQEVFATGLEMGFSYEELSRNLFRPFEPGQPDRRVTLTGTVATLRPGYAFIVVPGYKPDFYCPWTKFGKLTLARGMDVTFEVAFSARGGLSSNVRAV